MRQGFTHSIQSNKVHWLDFKESDRSIDRSFLCSHSKTISLRLFCTREICRADDSSCQWWVSTRTLSQKIKDFSMQTIDEDILSFSAHRHRRAQERRWILIKDLFLYWLALMQKIKLWFFMWLWWERRRKAFQTTHKSWEIWQNSIKRSFILVCGTDFLVRWRPIDDEIIDRLRRSTWRWEHWMSLLKPLCWCLLLRRIISRRIGMNQNWLRNLNHHWNISFLTWSSSTSTTTSNADVHSGNETTDNAKANKNDDCNCHLDGRGN